MLSNKPYLMRAFYDWIVDSAFTPLVVLNAHHSKCRVPEGFEENGEVVFNISPSAIRDLKISNASIEFKASFSGVIHFISAPIQAVNAIYAEENGEGVFFDAEEEESSGSSVVQLRGIEGSAKLTSITQDVQHKGDGENFMKEKPLLTLVD